MSSFLKYLLKIWKDRGQYYTCLALTGSYHMIASYQLIAQAELLLKTLFTNKLLKYFKKKQNEKITILLLKLLGCFHIGYSLLSIITFYRNMKQFNRMNISDSLFVFGFTHFLFFIFSIVAHQKGIITTPFFWKSTFPTLLLLLFNIYSSYKLLQRKMISKNTLRIRNKYKAPTIVMPMD
eukprot:TRINITY_DN6077_c0_g1_i1.p1 TRINITY_DN6077_c0_g1~~TRINITY_DN6077_c0_g1_i1.p1  ORF type:complete len:180 (-),score=11.73 TRINITY_DN6077_c0_g1_i1:5-544(-)